MTQQRSIERLLDAYMNEGPTAAPDRVLDAVADRIERQRQAFAWRLPGRTPVMTTPLRAAAAIAAVLILAAGAVYLAGSKSNVAGPTATPPASPSASPEASSKVLTSVVFRPTVSLDAPTHWQATDGARAYRLTTNVNDATGAPAGEVEIRGNPVVGSNASDCEGLAAPGIGTSVDAIVTALSSDPRFTTAPAGTVALGDRTAQMLDVRLAPGWTQACTWSGGQPAAVLLTVADPPGPFLGLGGPDRMRLILLDVDGIVVSIAISTADAPYFDAFVAETMPMVKTIRFNP